MYQLGVDTLCLKGALPTDPDVIDHIAALLNPVPDPAKLRNRWITIRDFETLQMMMVYQNREIRIRGSVPQVLGRSNVDGASLDEISRYNAVLSDLLHFPTDEMRITRIDLSSTVQPAFGVQTVLDHILALPGYRERTHKRGKGPEYPMKTFDQPDPDETTGLDYLSPNTKLVFYLKLLHQGRILSSENLRNAIRVELQLRANSFRPFGFDCARDFTLASLMRPEVWKRGPQTYFRWLDKLRYDDGRILRGTGVKDLKTQALRMMMKRPELLGVADLQVESFTKAFLREGASSSSVRNLRNAVLLAQQSDEPGVYVAKAFRDEMDLVRSLSYGAIARTFSAAGLRALPSSRN